MKTKIFFVGAGRMATAIVTGLLSKGGYSQSALTCYSESGLSAKKLAEETGIVATNDPKSALTEADCIVLACKPQQINALAPSIIENAEGKLVLSVLAGTSITRLKQVFPNVRNIVRTMPNTPGQIGAGVTAYASSTPLSSEDGADVETILSAMGTVYPVEESLLDAVTAVSGSGPAYVFELASALQEAGVEAGLPPALAASLAKETLLGSAKLLIASSESADDLRDAVTSPGGTTAAGLAVFEKNDLRKIVHDAVAAATARSIELGQ